MIETLAKQWLARQAADAKDDLLDEGDCRTCGHPAGEGHEDTDPCGIIAALLDALRTAQIIGGGEQVISDRAPEPVTGETLDSVRLGLVCVSLQFGADRVGQQRVDAAIDALDALSRSQREAEQTIAEMRQQLFMAPGRGPLRCQVTGNPVGTDTWAEGTRCGCLCCHVFMMQRELMAAERTHRQEIVSLRAQIDQERKKNDQRSCGNTEGSTVAPHEPPPPLRDRPTE